MRRCENFITIVCRNQQHKIRKIKHSFSPQENKEKDKDWTVSGEGFNTMRRSSHIKTLQKIAKFLFSLYAKMHVINIKKYSTKLSIKKYEWAREHLATVQTLCR